ncbi:MAG: tetratricopeptide repeat protein [Armatimonadia bacterium]
MPLVVFMLALGVRLVYLLQLRHSPGFACPIMDAAYHDQWARQIAAGDWVGREAFFRAPLYPYFLGTIYAIFGTDYLAVRVVQFVLGALTCVLIYWLGLSTRGRAVGLLAGLGAALYGPMIYYEGELQLPVLETLFAAALLLSVAVAMKRPERLGPWAMAGLSVGLFALTRPNVLVFVPVLAVYVLVRLERRVASKGIGALALVAAVCIAPVTIRNYVVSHDFVLISSQAGVNLYIGNNPQSDGVTAVVPGTRATWWGGYRDTINIAERAAGRALKPSEVSGYWTRQALGFITSQPVEALRLTLKKTFLFWYGHELGNNEVVYAATWHSPLLGALMWRWGPLRFPFGLLGPVALVGMGLVLIRREQSLMPSVLFVLAYSASVIAFLVCSRYRIPCMPALLVLAAYAVVEAVQGARGKQYQLLLGMVVVAAGLVLLLNHDFYGAGGLDLEKAHLDDAFRYGQTGRVAEAEREYRLAIAAEPTRIEPRFGLARLLYKQQRLDEAKELYRGVLSQDPDRWEALVGMAEVLGAEKRPGEAIPLLRRAIALDPAGTEAYAVLAGCLQAMGRKAEAEQALLSAPRDEAGGELIDRQLAQAAFEKEDYAGAEELCRKALARQPGDAATLLLLAQSLLSESKLVEAEEAARKSLDAKQSAEAWQVVAICRISQNDAQGAMVAATRAVELDPTALQARFILAGCLYERGQREAAVKHCKEILRQQPGFKPAKDLLEHLGQ